MNFPKSLFCLFLAVSGLQAQLSELTQDFHHAAQAALPYVKSATAGFEQHAHAWVDQHQAELSEKDVLVIMHHLYAGYMSIMSELIMRSLIYEKFIHTYTLYAKSIQKQYDVIAKQLTAHASWDNTIQKLLNEHMQWQTAYSRTGQLINEPEFLHVAQAMYDIQLYSNNAVADFLTNYSGHIQKNYEQCLLVMEEQIPQLAIYAKSLLRSAQNMVKQETNPQSYHMQAVENGASTAFTAQISCMRMLDYSQPVIDQLIHVSLIAAQAMRVHYLALYDLLQETQSDSVVEDSNQDGEESEIDEENTETADAAQRNPLPSADDEFIQLLEVCDTTHTR